MPKKRTRSGIKKSMGFTISKKQLTFILIGSCFVVGFLIGIVVLHMMSSGEYIRLSGYLENFFRQFDATQLQKMDMFSEAIFKYGKFIIIIWFLGFLPMGPPVSLLVMVAKGVGYGFSMALLVKTFGAIGVWYSFILYFVQNAILVPAYCYLIYQSMGYTSGFTAQAKPVATGKQTQNSMSLMEYIFVLIICMLCVLIASWFEAYAVPQFIYYYITAAF